MIRKRLIEWRGFVTRRRVAARTGYRKKIDPLLDRRARPGDDHDANGSHQPRLIRKVACF